MRNTIACLGITSCAVWCAVVNTVTAQPYTFSTIGGSALQNAYAEGTNGYSRFGHTLGVAVDNDGNVLVADTEHSLIRKISRMGDAWVSTRLAGGNYFEFGADGTNDQASFMAPAGVTVDNAGVIFVADSAENAIRKITPVGTNWVVSTIAGVTSQSGGYADGTNGAARFNYPEGIAVDRAGNLYVTDRQNHVIRKVSPVGTDWVVTTIAGRAGQPGTVDGTNSDARFDYFYGIACTPDGTLYVAETGANAIRRITPIETDWVVTTIDVPFNGPGGVAVDQGGCIYVADSGNQQIRRLAPQGTNWIVHDLGGLRGAIGSSNGTGTSARFNFPWGVAVDNSGNVFVADEFNFTIRRGEIAALLQTTRAAGQFTVAWPSATSNYVLETSVTLESNASWSPVSVTDVHTFGDNFYFTNNYPESQRYFRLRR